MFFGFIIFAMFFVQNIQKKKKKSSFKEYSSQNEDSSFKKREATKKNDNASETWLRGRSDVIPFEEIDLSRAWWWIWGRQFTACQLPLSQLQYYTLCNAVALVVLITQELSNLSLTSKCLLLAWSLYPISRHFLVGILARNLSNTENTLLQQQMSTNSLLLTQNLDLSLLDVRAKIPRANMEQQLKPNC